MSDNLSYDIRQLENLAECSEEARQVLVDIHRYFRKRAQRVFAMNGLKLQEAPHIAPTMSAREYKKIRPTHKWTVYKEYPPTKGKKTKLSTGTGLSEADSYSYLQAIAKRVGATLWNPDQRCYVNPAFIVTMEVQEIIYETHSANQRKTYSRRR